jgi:hypothetical protein
MSQLEDIECGNRDCTIPSVASYSNSPLHVANGDQDRDWFPPGANHHLFGESDSQDALRLLFTTYLKITEEEYNKTAERWIKDADVILIFVSPRFDNVCSVFPMN